jgi:polysaccharide deacetylase family protein (PEP-CTERM system associated)
MIHALTIDVEEYFHVHAFADVIDSVNWDEYPSRVVAATHRILELLAEAQVHATFFVLGWVARRHPQLVRAIRADGHEVASHGYFHQRVDSLTRDQFRADVRLAKQVIEDAAGLEVTAYRAPSFSITAASPWAHQVLVEEGHQVDSSLAAGRGTKSNTPADTRPYVIETPSGTITELPLPAGRLFGRSTPVGGGGYLRLFPYWLTRQQLIRLETKEQPFCVYFHPWEIDLDQPRLTAPWNRNLRHRIGISTMERKLRSLLNDFTFDSVATVLATASPGYLASAA